MAKRRRSARRASRSKVRRSKSRRLSKSRQASRRPRQKAKSHASQLAEFLKSVPEGATNDQALAALLAFVASLQAAGRRIGPSLEPLAEHLFAIVETIPGSGPNRVYNSAKMQQFIDMEGDLDGQFEADERNPCPPYGTPMTVTWLGKGKPPPPTMGQILLNKKLIHEDAMWDEQAWIWRFGSVDRIQGFMIRNNLGGRQGVYLTLRDPMRAWSELWRKQTLFYKLFKGELQLVGYRCP
jgi:hypothetical protein